MILEGSELRPSVYTPVLDEDIDLLAEIKWEERQRFVDAAQYELRSPFHPSGDQPQAIEELVCGLAEKRRNQVLLGVTGSGKTYTMAQVIARTGRPALILAHNKTLAAQLFSEMKQLFPTNAVEYFVSYYDYYQPEAYVPSRDLYIEKESDINEVIDRMRHSATRAMLERSDVIVVASVSCIFGIGSPDDYSKMVVPLAKNQTISPQQLARSLTELQYKNNRIDFTRGKFRINGDTLDIFPSHLEDRAVRVEFFGDTIEELTLFDTLTGRTEETLKDFRVYANSHHVTTRPTILQAVESIKVELTERLQELEKGQFLLERQRLEERTNYDIESLISLGMCPGIENYSRHLTGRRPGIPPPTLFEYLPSNAILFVDESHVTIPQVGAMFRGDFRRKKVLAEYGFRLPSCVDNRPLRFEEWEQMRPQTIFVSATPGDWELQQSEGRWSEQIIRPTGLPDPVCLVRPVESQVDDLLAECRLEASEGRRVLVTTLTKRMAEELDDYLEEQGIRSRYLHSEIDTLERVEIIQSLRRGEFDVLVGINLLREGLDIPECSLVAILDADKEGFLRSRRSLIQIIGRAARNEHGRAILYADKITPSMEKALNETLRRREKQLVFNAEHDIIPKSVSKGDDDTKAFAMAKADYVETPVSFAKENKIEDLLLSRTVGWYVDLLRQRMRESAKNMEFEFAARCRDELHQLESNDLDAPARVFITDEQLPSLLSDERARRKYANGVTSKKRKEKAVARSRARRRRTGG